MFERLPRELQVAVVRGLGRNDLKSFRLIGKAGDVATPVLFNTLHISPSRNSYHRARQLSGDERLSRHVRGVVYHFSCERLRDMFEVSSITLAVLAPNTNSTTMNSSSISWSSIHKKRVCVVSPTKLNSGN